MPTTVDYRRQLEAVANNATLALFIMDEHQHCTYMNPAAERLTGYRLEEVLGKPLHEYIHHTRPDGTPYPLDECPIDQAFPQNMREQGEEVFVHRDGRFYPVAFTASPILEDGRPVGTIIEVRDITHEVRQRAETTERDREAALSVAVGQALTSGGPLPEILQRCTQAVVDHLDAAFARIWTLNDAEQVLELQASAGMYTHLDGPHGRVPIGALKIGKIAAEAAPHLTNDVSNDDRVSEKEWARREGMVAFAGYPLTVEERVVGVLAMFSRRILSQRTLDLLGAVAGGIASTIVRRQAEEERERLLGALDLERSRLQTVFQQSPAFIATLRGPDHVFEMANPPYYELIGHREVIGRPVRDALPEVVEQGFLDLLDTVYRSGEAFIGTEVPVLLQREPGGSLEQRVVNFVYEPLPDADGQVSGILAHGVDVTELVRSREQLRQQARELEVRTEELRTQATQLEEVQTELEAANEDLVRSNEALERRSADAERARTEAEAAEAMLDAFFRAAPVAVGFLDRELRYRKVNQALAAIYGVDPAELIGRSIREVLRDSAAALEPLYERVIESGKPLLNVEVSIARPTDPSTMAHFLVNYFPVGSADEIQGVGLVALDVTHEKEAETARREEALIIESLHRVGQSLASGLEVERIVQDVTDAATSLTGAQFGAFFYNVLNENGEAYTLYTISGVPREAFSNFPMPRATPVFEPTFHGTGVVRSDDITQDPRYGRMAPYHGMPKGHLPVRSYLAVPVVSRTGEVVGGLFFGHPEPARFEERHERLAVGIAGWAAVSMDNAKLFEAEHRARTEAERANSVKSDFLATMSHELRTPLNAMIGYSDLLLAGVPVPIPESALQKVERIGISARHLLQLIEEILTFSRLEAGEEKVELGSVDLNEMVGEVQALIEPLALVKGILLDCRTPATTLIIESDARKIRQILINLLGNAVKFTDEGTVGLSLEEVGNDAFFTVTDTGPGIAPGDMEHVFTPFWQAETGSTRTKEGTGLGLSVTRRLARFLGGDVHVQSEVGRGSTFTVQLPREAPLPAAED